ncbi:MAG TPA: hypothetical protein VFC79_05625 [Tissierellaceae bacterium]|nr:hypothetical protein [Tissierellaceae bacterium]
MQKISESNRLFEINIRIEHNGDTFYLTDEDIEQGSFSYENSTQSGDDFTIGGTVASTIKFNLVNKAEYDGIDFVGARAYPTVGIEVRGEIDAHFIQPSQPSRMPHGDPIWEYVPLGNFNIDVADRTRNTINIKGIDDMIKLDKPYHLSKLKYPATLQEIFMDACSVGGVMFGSVDFPNYDYIASELISEELTLRNVIGFVAELAGGFAKFDRYGRLQLKWYEGTNIEIHPETRFDLKVVEKDIQITGVLVNQTQKNENDEDEVVVYLAGTEDYALDITDNPLLNPPYSDLLNNILNNVSGIVFRPYECSWIGNPAIDCGDMVQHTDIDGNVYNTIVTHMKYNYRGKCELSAKANPSITRGFKSTDNRIVNILRRLDKEREETGEQLDSLAEAQLQATELIANTLGGFVTRKEDGLYIHDSPSINDSTKIWKWGLGGFGYSDDGGVTYTTGITADGSVVASILTADMVKTGVLRSLNNKSWINLNDGTFKFGSMTYNGSTLSLSGNISGSTITGSTIISTDYPTEMVIQGSSLDTSEEGNKAISMQGRNISFYDTGDYDNMMTGRIGSSHSLKQGQLHERGFFLYATRASNKSTFLGLGMAYLGSDEASIALKIMPEFPQSTTSPTMNMDVYGQTVFQNRVDLGNRASIDGEGIVSHVTSSGTTSQGYYIRYTDGTMICWNTSTLTLSGMNKYTDYLYGGFTPQISFPASFISNPYVSVRFHMSEEIGVSNRVLSNSSLSCRLWTSTDMKGTREYSYFAIGRWK